MNTSASSQSWSLPIVFWSKKLTALTAAIALGGGGLLATSLDKAVALTVDGHTVTTSTYAGTVGDLLRGQGVEVGPRDLVFPSVDTKLSDGATVQVEFARKVTLLIDGKPTEFYTTATHLDEALAAEQVRGLDGADFSVARSMTIGREGLTVDVRTPREVVLKVAGKATRVQSTAATVAELLGEQNIGVRVDDTIKPALNAAVTDGQTITLTRITREIKTVKETVGFATIRTKSAKLPAGTTKVTTKGKAGQASVTYEYTTVNGDDATRKELKRVVITKPVTQRVTVGTKKKAAADSSSGRSSGKGINLARAAMWDRIAQCESGGNWSINTGNGYYGGLQFANASWRANGGTDFASRADLASRAEQITVANRYYAKAGLAPWGCRHAA